MAQCSQCERTAVIQGKCRPCWTSGLSKAKLRYVFTPALTQALRAAYAGDKCDLSKALTKLQQQTKWPRHAFKNQAVRLGITHQAGNWAAWTAAEDSYLADRVGVISPTRIARDLGRTVASVEHRARRLSFSLRCREGYTITDLAEVFGANHTTARAWVERGLLGRPREWSGLRVREQAVARFIRECPGEYDLRRVDQIWFKGMVFGALAGERE